MSKLLPHELRQLVKTCTEHAIFVVRATTGQEKRFLSRNSMKRLYPELSRWVRERKIIGSKQGRSKTAPVRFDRIRCEELRKEEELQTQFLITP